MQKSIQLPENMALAYIKLDVQVDIVTADTHITEQVSLTDLQSYIEELIYLDSMTRNIRLRYEGLEYAFDSIYELHKQTHNILYNIQCRAIIVNEAILKHIDMEMAYREMRRARRDDMKKYVAFTISNLCKDVIRI